LSTEKKKFKINHGVKVVWHVKFRDNVCSKAKWVESWLTNVYDTTTIIEQHHEHDNFEIKITQFPAENILGD